MSFILALLIYVVGGLVTFAGALFLAYSVYLAFIHWKYSDVPSPRMPSFYKGHLPDLLKLRKEIDEEVSLAVAVDVWLQRVDSKTFIIFFFHIPTVLTVDPAVVKEIVMNIKNDKNPLFVQGFSEVFGRRFMRKGLAVIPNYEIWKPRRQLYDLAFKKSYLKSLTSTFNEMTDKTLNQLKPLADGKTVVPLKKYIKQLAQEIISEVAFGTDFSKIWTAESLGLDQPNETDQNLFSYLINTSLQGLNVTFTSILPSLNQYLYPRDAKKYQECVDALRTIGKDCILKRIKKVQNEEEIPQDILTYMLSNTTDSVDIEDLVDDFITFYTAGQETSASTIMFALILLFLNPNTLERLQEEVNDVLGDRTVVTNEDLEELQYTEQVLYETLRLYPPAFGQAKQIESSLKIGNFTVPAKSSFLLMTANMSRQSEYFEDPEVFNPDRFHPDNEKPDSFMFFPFGVGHRSCIGKQFALMEGKTALAKIIQTFTIKFPEDYTINAIARLTLQPKDDLLCTLIKNNF